MIMQAAVSYESHRHGSCKVCLFSLNFSCSSLCPSLSSLSFLLTAAQGGNVNPLHILCVIRFGTEPHGKQCVPNRVCTLTTTKTASQALHHAQSGFADPCIASLQAAACFQPKDFQLTPCADEFGTQPGILCKRHDVSGRQECGKKGLRPFLHPKTQP